MLIELMIYINLIWYKIYKIVYAMPKVQFINKKKKPCCIRQFKDIENILQTGSTNLQNTDDVCSDI